MTSEENTTETKWPDGEGPVRQEAAQEPDNEETLIIDILGYEGPMDLLLELARQHKIDLSQISMLALVEQYLAFIEQARQRRLEIAADYLVMAAWLAYLKSRLLLPRAPGDEEVPAEDLAAQLSFRLQKLQAMREAAAKLMARDRLGRDVFERGDPEKLVFDTRVEYTDNLIDLLKAYTTRRQKLARHNTYTIKRIKAWSIKDARQILERLVGRMDNWNSLDSWLADYFSTPEGRATVVASSFTASLELAREGVIEIRQERAFEPIYMRRRASAA
ncbi:segregation/condensation protein A [Nordella sp. HKS 07]|uniref:segregation and condensation protein A n=1 Tax=Nordella sp. HKS 07 TaxID=2712222 RepID=UPI0013E14E9B|nr:ScpA family protein [Nordella sp. HKS 07]QIG51231.1 segregation/condensation protein A [Nordella sp. HKS 07]